MLLAANRTGGQVRTDFSVFPTPQFAKVSKIARSFPFFSAPEHKVLRVSYCDSVVSVMHLPSCVVNFLPCVRSRGHIFCLMKLGQTSSKMGNFGSKTRSLSQILELVYALEATFSVIMKLSQNVCLDEISNEFKNGSYWVKNKVTRSNFRKSFCML